MSSNKNTDMSSYFDTIWSYAFPVATISYILFDLRSKSNEKKKRKQEKEKLELELSYIYGRLDGHDDMLDREENELSGPVTPTVSRRDRAWKRMMSMYGSANR